MPKKKPILHTSPGTSRQNLPGDVTPPLPQGFLAEATALFSAGKMSVELYKQLQTSQNSIDVSVIGSLLVGEHHHVSFECRNNTLHGLYLESLTIALPEKRNVPLDAVEVVEKPESVSYGSHPTTYFPIETWFPRYIAQGQELRFTIRFPVLMQTIHEQVPYLVGTLTVSRLNEKKPSVIQQDFRVRWK